LGDAPFYGYTAKRGYANIHKSNHKSSMKTFLDDLNLRNTFSAQMTARIWHNARPRKVGTLIWLILNKGLPVGSWLQQIGLPSQCKVCDSNLEESAQHLFLNCPMARSAWEAFKRVWTEWQAPHELKITWPFALLDEAAMEQEDDPPGTLAYHSRGFTYPRQALDILRSFIIFRLWTERCRKHFDDKYSLKAVLTQAWVATVEVGMASWKAIRSQRPTKDPDVQARIELDFRNEWLHLNILGSDHATIRWHFLPPLYFLPLSND
jgi:hypothetical protein